MTNYRGYDDLKIIPRNGREYHIDRMAAAELEELEMLLADDLTAIKDSLAAARAAVVSRGEYADPDWYRRAQTARRIKARQLEMVKRARKAAGRQTRVEGRPLAEFFMDAARLSLRADVFDAVMATAEELRDEALERAAS